MVTEKSSLSGRFYAVFHRRKRIHIRVRECGELPVVNTDADCALLFGTRSTGEDHLLVVAMLTPSSSCLPISVVKSTNRA